MADPYEILGVSREAGEDEIRSAYRRQAKKYHPDLNPGDKSAEDKFKELNAAYDLLSDPEKRARYDRGDIDATGQERPQQQRAWRGFADAGGAKYYSYEGFGDTGGMEDLFRDLFGGGFRPGAGGEAGAGAAFRARGADVRYTLTVGFREAAEGAQKTVTMPDGRTLKITIPPGLHDGQTLRLKGQGEPGLGGGPPGDAHIEVHVEPDPVFERRDHDIQMELPISVAEAVLGGKVEVPTLTGPVMLTIPKGANSGTSLRIRGKGIRDARTGQRGDQYVRLRVMLPPAPDPELEAFVKEWAARHPYDPRTR